MRKRIQDVTVETKTGRVPQACLRYNLGRCKMRKIAEDAGALIKIGSVVLVNYTIMDEYMDGISM